MSAFAALIRATKVSDYAVFIGSADESSTPNSTERREAEGTRTKHRDNVVFELGLFTGALGKNRCFYLVDKETTKTIMTDYNGITVKTYDSSNIKAQLNDIVDSIKKHFNKSPYPKHSLFPTLALARGYLDNFISPIILAANENDGFLTISEDKQPISEDEIYMDKDFSNFSIEVILPISLGVNIQQKFTQLINESNKNPLYKIRRAKIKCSGSDRSVQIILKNQTMQILDMPTTFSAGIYVIKELIGNDSSSLIEDIIKREAHYFGLCINDMIRHEYGWQNCKVNICTEVDVEAILNKLTC